MGPCVRRDGLLRDCTRPRPINVRLNSVICDSPAPRREDERRYLFATFPAVAFFSAFFLPSSSNAFRTFVNSSSDTLSALGNRRFRVSSVLTMAEPITTHSNHL